MTLRPDGCDADKVLITAEPAAGSRFVVDRLVYPGHGPSWRAGGGGPAGRACLPSTGSPRSWSRTTR